MQAIRCLYDNSSSRVRVGHQLSDRFDVTIEVLQGDILVPFLFLIVVDYIMRQVPSIYGFTTHQESGIVLHDLDYADDIALLDETDDAALPYSRSMSLNISGQ